MTVAADLPTEQRQRRQAIFERYLDELVRILTVYPGMYGWQIWLHFEKHDFSRSDVTDLLQRAIDDRWIRAGDFGRYYAIVSTEEDHA